MGGVGGCIGWWYYHSVFWGDHSKAHGHACTLGHTSCHTATGIQTPCCTAQWTWHSSLVCACPGGAPRGAVSPPGARHFGPDTAVLVSHCCLHSLGFVRLQFRIIVHDCCVPSLQRFELSSTRSTAAAAGVAVGGCCCCCCGGCALGCASGVKACNSCARCQPLLSALCHRI